MDTIKYNATRPYSRETWRKIQRTVGAGSDGIPGPKTAAAVKAWQRANGLIADGQVGRKTFERLGLDPRDVWSVAAIRAMAPGRAVGIDVSHYQGDIDWTKTAREVDFVWMRASIGGKSSDDKIVQNWLGAQTAGIPRGAYHLALLVWKGRVTDPKAQAANLKRVIKGDAGDLPPVLDLENKEVRKLYDIGGARAVSDWTEAWMAEAERLLGVKPILYVSWHTVGSMLEDRPAIVAGAHWWPYYPGPWAPEPWPEGRAPFDGRAQWCCRQISDKGIVDGIEGNVDLDVLPGGINDLLALGRKHCT